MANSLDLNPQLVRIKLPFSVIQLWNDLEIGQVVKLPARNNSDDPVTILAHRDGEETICLEFTKTIEQQLDEVAGDGFDSEVIIVRVEQTFIDSASETRVSPTTNHKPCDNVTSKKLSKKIANKKQDDRSRKKVVEENGPDNLEMECDDSVDDEDHSLRNGNSGSGTMKLPVVISPVSSSGSAEKKSKAQKRRTSDEGDDGSFSSSDDPTPKRSRGEKKYHCELCGAIFIYFTSYMKHMKRHGGNAAAAAEAAADKTAAIPQKLPKILPKPPEHQHHMVTRRYASLSSPPTSKNDSKASPLAVGLLPAHVILPRPISPVFTSSTPLIVPTITPLQVSAGTINTAVLPSTVNPTPTPMVASHKPPPNVRVQNDGTHLLHGDDPLDCWVCLRQFKYPTSFLKHMRIEHEVIVKVEEHGDRRKRSNVSRKPSMLGMNTADTMTSDSINQGTGDQDDFRGHQSGQVVALQMKPNGDYVVVDGDMNEIVLGEYLLCSICLTSFNFKMEYIKHMSRSHGILVKDLTEDGNELSAASTPSKVDTQVFQCHVCNKKFFYRIPYEQHLKQIHNISMVVMDGSQQTPNESYICRLCTMVFLYKTSFEKHMQREHGVEMPADGFSDGAGTSNSQRSGSPVVDSMMFRCNLCLAWFKDSTDLDDHIISQHANFTGGRYNNTEKTESKDVGPERVKDPDSKLSLIQCDHCSRTFKFRIAYSKHLRNAHQDKTADDAADESQSSKTNKSATKTSQSEKHSKTTKVKEEPGLEQTNDLETETRSENNNTETTTEDMSPENLSLKDRNKSKDVHKDQELPEDLSSKTNTRLGDTGEVDAKSTEPGKEDTESTEPKKVDTVSTSPGETDTESTEPGKVDSESKKIKKVDSESTEPGKVDNESKKPRKVESESTEPENLDTESKSVTDMKRDGSCQEMDVSTEKTDLKSGSTNDKEGISIDPVVPEGENENSGKIEPGKNYKNKEKVNQKGESKEVSTSEDKASLSECEKTVDKLKVISSDEKNRSKDDDNTAELNNQEKDDGRSVSDSAETYDFKAVAKQQKDSKNQDETSGVTNKS